MSAQAREAAAEPDDAELVAEVLAGRSEVYEQLVRRHQAALFRFACGMVGDPDTAADMVQDTLVRAYSRLGGFAQRDRFSSWLFQILRNRCRDHLKAPWWRRRVALEPRHDLPAAAPSALTLLEQRDSGRALRRAMAALPVAQREAFLLKHVEELSYEEMAERLGSGVSALKMRVLRAREALQAALGADPDCDAQPARSSSLTAEGNR